MEPLHRREYCYWKKFCWSLKFPYVHLNELDTAFSMQFICAYRVHTCNVNRFHCDLFTKLQLQIKWPQQLCIWGKSTNNSIYLCIKSLATFSLILRVPFNHLCRTKYRWTAGSCLYAAAGCFSVQFLCWRWQIQLSNHLISTHYTVIINIISMRWMQSEIDFHLPIRLCSGLVYNTMTVTDCGMSLHLCVYRLFYGNKNTNKNKENVKTI